MAGLTMRLTRTMSLSSRRFLRDVAASVLATGVASLAFSQLAHETGPRSRALPAGKFEERLSWRTEDVPTRQTTTYDAVAMFSLPLSVETAWSDAAVRTEAGADAARVDLARLDVAKLDVAKLDLGKPEPARATRVRSIMAVSHLPSPEATEPRVQRITFAMPPARPVDLSRMEAAAASNREGEPRPIRVLGWAVPGSDLIPSAPEALQKVASLGNKVASFGGAIVETVGLR